MNLDGTKKFFLVIAAKEYIHLVNTNHLFNQHAKTKIKITFVQKSMSNIMPIPNASY